MTTPTDPLTFSAWCFFVWRTVLLFWTVFLILGLSAAPFILLWRWVCNQRGTDFFGIRDERR